MLVYFVAFLAGVVTAISPCAYPVLPIVFAGGASGSRRRPYAIIAGLVTTFVVSLLVLTWILDRLGLPQDLLRNISIGLLFLVAATLIVPEFGGSWSGRSRGSASVPRAISAAASCSARALASCSRLAPGRS